jgi:hypothetical protein
MDKWSTKRLRLVLPTSIIEEEIAEANAAIMSARKKSSGPSSNFDFKLRLVKSLHKPLFLSDCDNRRYSNRLTTVNESDITLDDNQADENLDHDELLRRARSRLLEDLSQSSIASGEKDVLILPHSLKKYKEIYNNNGRIGIYTPAERAAIIARFQKKRKNRVWNKKIRYNCRKNLADRRLRIKGRFVKRESSSLTPLMSPKLSSHPTRTNQDDFNYIAPATITATNTKNSAVVATQANAVDACLVQGNTDVKIRRKVPPNYSAIKLVQNKKAIQSNSEEKEIVEDNDQLESEKTNDIDTPDVTDPEAGFCPTNELPYRRLRRYTIT